MQQASPGWQVITWTVVSCRACRLQCTGFILFFNSSPVRRPHSSLLLLLAAPSALLHLHLSNEKALVPS